MRLEPGATADEADLVAHWRDRLASYKTPRRWALVDSFPLTRAGKIQKRVLRERLQHGDAATTSG